MSITIFSKLVEPPVTNLERARDQIRDRIIGTAGADLSVGAMGTFSLYLHQASCGVSKFLAAAKALPGAAEPTSEHYIAAEAQLAAIPGMPRDGEGNRTIAALLYNLGVVKAASADYHAAVADLIAAVPGSALIRMTMQTDAETGAQTPGVEVREVIPAKYADPFRADARVVAMKDALTALVG